ncbi:hypothetical protein BST81_08010 [Leptolyngbya sp. 'hensonii']|uniref:DUF3598 family protein n=1 Tax=Leptolyngbya sp. 'hensonii' TaxID=1922337 RepID=UPI00094F7664|nr:DUF3598 family protein [Leptolyngbya sp. 'hensonii']OLP18853.1 hypothetical protein BST81_08010 [Leptolyngbya sp. 'hensonii']
MKSQWDCLLQNLGAWEGSFTRLSPQGSVIEDTPTLVTLEGLQQQQTIRQTIRRYYPHQVPQETVLEYSTLGRGILFFETGAFSQGSIQLAPSTEFGAEFGFIEGDRRWRLVELFDPQGNLKQFTLIRERRAGSSAPESPSLQVADLVGTWQGEAVTLSPDWRSETCRTTLQITLAGDHHLEQQLTFGDGPGSRRIGSTAQILGSSLRFEQGDQPVQVLLLPQGGSATCPLRLQPGQPFFLEAGWLSQPDRRQRLIRQYDEKGGWVSLTLVTEQKTHF